MPLGTEVSLGSGHIVLDGNPAPPCKGHSSPPLFDRWLLWPNGRPSQQLLSSCQNSFTVRLGSKFITSSSFSIPPRLKCVITLPCEIFVVFHSAQRVDFCATLYCMRITRTTEALSGREYKSCHAVLRLTQHCSKFVVKFLLQSL